MADFIERKTYRAGDIIFREGDSGTSAYIIQSGLIEISRKTDDGQVKVLAQIGPGGVFGEMALVDDKPRMASAMVAEAATIITVTKQMYNDKLKKTDPFIRGLLKILVETIRRSS
ncbi:MAG: cyclic nucleotide-binding domain-containing protein [Proteobacteria bacterium]|nr:cyclic nucleotide-binding domain-containing protein [Pseudomonadota bacterium]